MEPNKNIVNNAAEEANAPATKFNKKALVGVAAVVLAVLIIWAVVFIINKSAANKADEAVAIADLEMNDSIQLENYKKAAELGTKSGNRAKLHVAIALYDKGEYQEAIKYLDDASVDSEIIEPGQYSLMGDCYVNLKEYDKALSSYDKAIKAANNNPQIVPFILVKEANVYREQKNYDAEYKAYETIFNKYPEYATRLSFDIRKYMERAKAQAGK